MDSRGSVLVAMSGGVKQPVADVSATAYRCTASWTGPLTLVTSVRRVPLGILRRRSGSAAMEAI